MRKPAVVVQFLRTLKPLRTEFTAGIFVIQLDVKKPIGFRLENVAAERTSELGMTKK